MARLVKKCFDLPTLSIYGASANSNGNTSKQISFSIEGIDPHYTGFTQTFGPSEIYGFDYYTEKKENQKVCSCIWRTKIDSLPGKWFLEGKGIIQTLTLGNGKATINQIVEDKLLRAPDSVQEGCSILMGRTLLTKTINHNSTATF